MRSEVRLDAPTAGGGGAIDLGIVWGARHSVPADIPAGTELLARLDLPGASCSLTDGRSGYTLRMHGLCDFELDAEMRRLRVRLTPDADRQVAPLLIGSALAAVLSLSGHCVLHASAVASRLGAVALVGTSGMGKTTLAAMCCAAGTPLVGDDVLRVECGSGGAWCYSGSDTLRLRTAAAGLGRALSNATVEETIDGRAAARPPGFARGRVPLAAVIVPDHAAGASSVRVERLRGADAMAELVRYPRTVGWVDVRHARRDFDVLARLARVVTVCRVVLPQGPPFLAETAAEMLRQVEATIDRPAASPV